MKKRIPIIIFFLNQVFFTFWVHGWLAKTKTTAHCGGVSRGKVCHVPSLAVAVGVGNR